MPTLCACGKVIDADKPRVFVMRSKPCACSEPEPSRRGIVIHIPGTPRDPARAKLGLPDRTPLEKAALRGTINE